MATVGRPLPPDASLQGLHRRRGDPASPRGTAAEPRAFGSAERPYPRSSRSRTAPCSLAQPRTAQEPGAALSPARRAGLFHPPSAQGWPRPRDACPPRLRSPACRSALQTRWQRVPALQPPCRRLAGCHADHGAERGPKIYYSQNDPDLQPIGATSGPLRDPWELLRGPREALALTPKRRPMESSRWVRS
eukprot:scaffold1459_cov260-Pinguiococcus_pyrenoidosus.AAC.3